MHNKHIHRVIVLAMILNVIATGVSSQENANFVQRALADSSFAWRSIASNKIRIYYEEDSFAERHRMMMLRSMITAVDEVLKILEASECDSVLNVFYVESREKMKRIVGRSYSGFSDWAANAIFMVLNPNWRSFEKHEFAHVVTMGVWGPPDITSRWMIEGIAIHCDGWCREYTVDEVAFHLLSNGQLPPLREFLDDFNSLGEIRAGFYAASLIGFIQRTHGAQALRDIWLNGVESFKDLLGADVNQIENSWKNYLKSNVRQDTKVDIDIINKLGCG